MRRILFVALAMATMVPPAVLSTPASAQFAEAPSDVAAAKKKQSIGTISIPRLKVKARIYLGVTDREFNIGVGQWPGTPKFGGIGNIVLGGHRTSAYRPFAEIQELRGGDLIALTSGKKTFRYRVTGRSIVQPTALWITNPTRTPTLTLFSCHPKGQTTHRYVVRAVLIK
jgi:sortase A